VIINTANQIEPGFLSFDKSFVLTGLADEYLIYKGVFEEKSIAQVNSDNIDVDMALLSSQSRTH